MTRAEPIHAPWNALVGGVRVRFGSGRLGELPELAAALGAARLLVVTDPGVRAAGHVEPIVAALARADLEVELWDRVSANPTTDEVAAGAAAAAGRAVQLIVAVGGGSALDAAKGINFLLTNDGPMARFRGYDRNERPLLPAIGVPTTAGTGSEAQSYALISDAQTHDKLACGAESARFHTVFLDPTLAATAPRRVAAAAGLDALSHAVESHVTLRRNPISSLYSGRAFALLDGALESVLAEPPEGGRWGELLLGAHLAGAAIEQSMLGAAHAAANPLTARHGVTHGVAVLLMLPAVVRFNAAVAGRLYGELPGVAGPDPAEALAARLEALRSLAGLPGRLREAGVARRELAALAGDAAGQWTGRFNPRSVDREEFERLYEACF